MAQFGRFAPRGQGGLQVVGMGPQSLGSGIPTIPMGSSLGGSSRVGGGISTIPLPPISSSTSGGGGQSLTPELRQQAEDVISQLYMIRADKRDEFLKKSVMDFANKNLTPEAMESVVQIITKGAGYGQHHGSVLTKGLQALNLIENVGAGFVGGMREYQRAHTGKKDIGSWSPGALAHQLNPWQNLHAIGAGFNNVDDAVKKHYTYEDLIKGGSKPGSLTYKFAMPIGLGTAILWDPTTYLTFGAGGVSKTVAVKSLAIQTDLATKEAVAAIHAGQYGGDLNKLHEAVVDIKAKRGYAMDLGDALDQMRAKGFERKAAIRKEGQYFDPTTGAMIDASTKEKIGAYLAPGSAKGGRGVRFAGATIPGTPGLGAEIGKSARALSATDTPLGSAIKGAQALLIPGWKTRHIMGDDIRSSALVAMQEWKTIQQTLTQQVAGEVRALQKVTVYPEHAAAGTAPSVEAHVPGSAAPYGLPGVKARLGADPEQQAAVAIAGTPEVVKVSKAERQGLLNVPYHELPEGSLKNLHNAITTQAEQFIKDAAKHGGATEDEMRTLWGTLAKSYRDPLAALFDFKLKSSMNIAAKQWTEHILKDRRFALPMYHGKEAQKLAEEKIEAPLAKGHLRPTHIGARSEVTLADGSTRTMKQADAEHFVAGHIDDAAGKPVPVDQIMQVRGSDGQLIWRQKGFLPRPEGMKLLTEAPSGYSMFTQGNRHYAVVDSVRDSLVALRSPQLQAEALAHSIGMRFITSPQNFWKKYATSPNPAFHVMNALGAMWNNLLAGIYNPIDYWDSARMLYKAGKEEAAQAGDSFLWRNAESTPAGRAALETVQAAEARTGLGRSSYLFGEVTRKHENLPQEIEQGLMGVGAKRGKVAGLVLPDANASLREGAKFYAKRTRQATAAGLLATMNPVGLFLLAPEAAHYGTKLTGMMENWVRLAPFMKYSKDPEIKAAIAHFGPITVPNMAHPGWTKEHQAAMYDIGSEITKKYQFDYTDLTYTERYMAKTVFPFWSYYKKNFALQVAEAIKQPRKIGGALRLMNFMNEQGDDLGPYKAVLPTYFENIQAFQVPVPDWARKKLGLPKNQPLYLNPKMPFLSINMIPPLWDIINDPHETTPQKILEALAPVAGAIGPLAPFPFPGGKMLLEAGTGHNLGLNRPIDYQGVNSNSYRNSYQPAPFYAKYMPTPVQHFFGMFKSKKSGKMMMTATGVYMLNQISTPFINNLGQSVPIEGATAHDKGKARADMVSWITGVRLMPVDVLRLTRNEAYSIKNVLEAKQSEQRQQGKELNDKDYDLLGEVNDQLEVLNAVYDEREGIVPSG